MPILNTVEMGREGADWGDITTRLAASKPLALSPFVPPALSAWLSGRGYPGLFDEAFGTSEITPARIAMAIASYERTLFSDRAPIDLVVSEIIPEPAAEGRGREIFLDSKCDACHRAGLFSDNRFHAIGLRPTDEDEGPPCGHWGSQGRGPVPHSQPAQCRPARPLHAQRRLRDARGSR